jgi:hypothetical protein
MFWAFHPNVAKADLECCICCDDNILMLQAYVFECFSCFKSIFQVFHHDVAKIYLHLAQHVCLKRMFQVFQVFYTYVASVLSGCCIYCYGYTRMCSNVCFKCFIYFQSLCCKCFYWMFKSRYGGAHVTMAPVAGKQRPAIATCYYCWGVARGSPCGHLRPVDDPQAGWDGRGGAPVCYGPMG